MSSRQRLLSAAVDCILEKGYYRASSNEIARRAGLSWGLIQYYFGSRERLLLAVFEDASQQLMAHSRAAVISGDTIGEQLTSYFEFLMGFYGRREYLAFIEIIQNLGRDPGTSEETTAVMRRLDQELRDHWVMPPLLHGRHRVLVFETLRGLILSHLLRVDHAVTSQVDEQEEFERRVAQVIEALAAYLDRPADDEGAGQR